ncbi:MAG TPA: Gfo/Idh/MocA family oxidoreductase, partial [Thermoanaerobaculia bacterium]|nr:Gfo/Idh/MocA family oxidoreductase [Thermoanaerobaculia bacterium]
MSRTQNPGTRLRTVLVGCGRIGERHARILASSPESQLVGMADLDLSKAQAFAGKHGGRPYADLSAMMAAESPDLLAVCTPSGMHAEGVIAACRAGIRNIVVEKPMALLLPDADAMIAACEKSRTRLFVVKQNRYNLPIQKLREALQAGRFGRLVLGAVRVRWCRRQDYYDQAPWRGTWAMDGGVFSNQASHHVDMLVHMMGEVGSVKAMAATRLVSIEAEDTGLALLRFTSGALGVIEATTAARPMDLEGSISILGENGTVEVGGFAMNEMTAWKFADESPEDAKVLERYRTNPPDVYGFGHHEYYRDVFNAIAKEEPPFVDGLEGRRSLEVITAIYESIESGREVRFPFKVSYSRLGKPKGP